MSLPRYAEYKGSGVAWLGEVPGHWSVVPLGTLSTSIQTGPFGSQLHSEDYLDDETPVINPSNIQNGKLIADTSCTVSPQIVERLSEHKLAAGDIVFARRGEMGRCAMVGASEEGWLCGTGSLNVRLSDKALPEFVSKFLGTPHVKELLKLESVGSTMDNLNTAILSRVRVPIPSIEEQSAIAAFLDRETGKIDTLIAEQEKLLTLLAEKRQAAISHAVTRGLNPNATMKDSGVPWLGEVPAHWEVVPIKHLSPVQRGASPRPIDDPKYFDEEGEYSWVRIADVSASDGYLESTTQQLSELGSSLSVKLKPGDLFVSIAGTVGKPCISKIKACIHDGFVYFPRLELPPIYLYRIFEAGVCYAGLGKMGTQLNLNTDTIGSIKVAIPPTEELNKILAFLAKALGRLDSLRAEAERGIGLLKERRSALIAAAVTGKIDVRISSQTTEEARA